jgi:hypothetical protein
MTLSPSATPVAVVLIIAGLVAAVATAVHVVLVDGGGRAGARTASPEGAAAMSMGAGALAWVFLMGFACCGRRRGPAMMGRGSNVGCHLFIVQSTSRTVTGPDA